MAGDAVKPEHSEDGVLERRLWICCSIVALVSLLHLVAPLLQGSATEVALRRLYLMLAGGLLAACCFLPRLRRTLFGGQVWLGIPLLLGLSLLQHETYYSWKSSVLLPAICWSAVMLMILNGNMPRILPSSSRTWQIAGLFVALPLVGSTAMYQFRETGFSLLPALLGYFIFLWEARDRHPAPRLAVALTLMIAAPVLWPNPVIGFPGLSRATWVILDIVSNEENFLHVVEAKSAADYLPMIEYNRMTLGAEAFYSGKSLTWLLPFLLALALALGMKSRLWRAIIALPLAWVCLDLIEPLRSGVFTIDRGSTSGARPAPWLGDVAACLLLATLAPAAALHVQPLPRIAAMALRAFLALFFVCGTVNVVLLQVATRDMKQLAATQKAAKRARSNPTQSIRFEVGTPMLKKYRESYVLVGDARTLNSEIEILAITLEKLRDEGRLKLLDLTSRDEISNLGAQLSWGTSQFIKGSTPREAMDLFIALRRLYNVIKEFSGESLYAQCISYSSITLESEFLQSVLADADAVAICEEFLSSYSPKDDLSFEWGALQESKKKVPTLRNFPTIEYENWRAGQIYGWTYWTISANRASQIRVMNVVTLARCLVYHKRHGRFPINGRELINEFGPVHPRKIVPELGTSFESLIEITPSPFLDSVDVSIVPANSDTQEYFNAVRNLRISSSNTLKWRKEWYRYPVPEGPHPEQVAESTEAEEAP